MVRRLCLAASLALLLAPSLARANVVWRGDFESGNLSQWSKSQIVSADRAQVVSSPVTQGRYALKVTVKQGDNPIGASGNRNEVLYLSYEPRGTERWYRWQTMWDPSYPNVNTWQLFTQWHHSGSSGSPPLEFYVVGNEIWLRVNASTVVWKAPLVRGVWHDFVFHVKWSPDASEGFIELWFNGKLVLPKKYVANQFSGQTNYLKVGLYRNDTITQDGVVYHDGWTIGETQQDVLDAPQAPADAGVVAPPPPPPPGPDASTPGPDASFPGPDASQPEPGPDASEPDPEPQPGPDAGEPDPEPQPAPGPDTGEPEPEPTPDAGLVPAADAGADDGPDGEPFPTLPTEEMLGCSTTGFTLTLPAALLALALLRRRRD